MRRALAAVAAFGLSLQAVWADPDQLVDAMGLPALIEAFATDGVRVGQTIDDGFLNGQGGQVWTSTVAQLYDPTRIEAEMRGVMAATLDAEVAAQALLFFASDIGAKVVSVEIEARRAFLNPALEDAAKAAPAAQADAVTALLETRDLIERNAETTVRAQLAFYDGLIATSGQGDAPDADAARARVLGDTEAWLRGYYALIHSALTADEIAIYRAFWDTEVGRAVDDALFAAFGDSYTTLSFGLGQAAGRLLPQSEL